MTKTSDELKAAANRLSQCRGSLGVEGVYGISIRVNQKRIQSDRRLLANAYLDTLDEQQRIAEMRALPIDPEWLKSIGFNEDVGYFVVRTEMLRFTVMDRHLGWWDASLNGTILSIKLTNCGELLDLLAALKIEPKGA